jgi:hypothetical protein
MSKRKNAGKGFGMMFHGAFGLKSEAKKKERKVDGFIQPRNIRGKRRYVVMSERKNPRRKNPGKAQELKRLLDSMNESQHREFLQRTTMRMPSGKQKTILKKYWLPIARLVMGERSSNPNPHELLVMGANPSSHSSYTPRDAREIVVPPGSTITIRTNPTNPDRYTSAQALATGARYHAPALIQTKRQKRVAGMVRKARKHKYDWIPAEGLAPGQNPDETWMYQAVAELFPGRSLGELSSRELSKVALRAHELQKQARQNPTAADLREEFTGMPAEYYTVRDEPHMPAGNYAQLGRLLALYFKPTTHEQVHSITWGKQSPILVSNETGRQLWFVGGDQDIGNTLGSITLAYPIAQERSNGIWELGELRRIDYRQRKEHVPHPESDEWRHDFGHENGVRPNLLYDANHRRLLLEGGDYRIEREGIIN